MSEHKQDLRVTKTQRNLQNAMTELLEKKPFEKITVNDLCHVALISRTAFYDHFEDKYALLRFCMDQVKRDLQTQAAEKGDRTLFTVLVNHIYANPRIYKNLIMEEGRPELTYMIDDLLAKVISEKIIEMEEMPASDFQVPLDVWAIFCAGGLTNLLLWLLRNDFPVDKDTMTRYLIDMYELVQ